MLFLLLFYTLFSLCLGQTLQPATPTTAQTECIVGQNAGSCLWCPVGLNAWIGAPNSTANTNQELRVGAYSKIIRVGLPVDAPSYVQDIQLGAYSRNIIIGRPTATGITQTISIGIQSNSTNIATGNTPSVVIGTSSPVTPAPNQAQEVYLFQYSRNVRIGENTVGSILIGTNSGIVSLGTGSTAGTLNLGSLTTPSSQSVTLGQASPSIQIGNPSTQSQTVAIGVGSNVINIGTSTTAPNIITIGRPTRPSPTPTSPSQSIALGAGATSVTIGTFSDTIAVGSPSALNQQIDIGVAATIINIGSTASVANPTITIGRTTSPGAPVPTFNLRLGLAATAITMGTDSSAGSITIGATAGPSSQIMYLAQNSSRIDIANGVTTINFGKQSQTATAQQANLFMETELVYIGKTTPTPSPQGVRIGLYSTTASFGTDATNVFVATGTNPTAYFGRLARSPTTQTTYIGYSSTTVQIGTDAVLDGTLTTQTVTVGPYATTVGIGANSPTINIGSPSAAPAQSVSVGLGAANVYIGTEQPSSFRVVIGKTPAPSVAPSPTSSLIQLNGLYHYFYSAECTDPTNSNLPNYSGGLLCNGVPTPTPVPNRQGNVAVENVPTFSPVSPVRSGYVYIPSASSTTGGRFYPPQTGYWIFTAQCMLTGNAPTGPQAWLDITDGGTVVSRALKDSATAPTYTVVTAHYGRVYNTIGANADYIGVVCDDCETSTNNANRYCRFTAYRAA